MQFAVSSSGPLTGRIRLPGDLRLTLMLMSFGMFMEEQIAIKAPNTSREVLEFRSFLEQNGASITNSEDGFTFKGKRLTGDITIDSSISDSVIHFFAAAAVFSARTVRITGGATTRSRFVEPLLSQLALLGAGNEHVCKDGDDIVLKACTFKPLDVVPVRSQWALETVLAATIASQAPVTVSFTPGILPFSERALEALGFELEAVEKIGSSNLELERRLAKVAGNRPPEVKRFQWTGTSERVFEIPGDTTVASAVAGCAAAIQRSDVTIEGVFWNSGRRGFFDALRRMKATIANDTTRKGKPFDYADIHVGWSAMDGVHITPEQAETMRSELLLLAAAAASARGKTVISDTVEPPGAGREAFKLVAHGLEKYGVHIGDFTEGIVLSGGNEFKGCELNSGGRPDVACALAVVGLTAAGETIIHGSSGDLYPVGDVLRLVGELSGHELL